MDKEEVSNPHNFFERAVNYLKAYYKEFCYKLYDIDKMIIDYENLGFNIRPFFANVAESNIVGVIDSQGLNFLEEQW